MQERMGKQKTKSNTFFEENGFFSGVRKREKGAFFLSSCVGEGGKKFGENCRVPRFCLFWFFCGLNGEVIANGTIIASLRGPSLLKGKWDCGCPFDFRLWGQ